MSQFEKNLTQGSVTRQLIAFSMPFLLSNFIQAIYSVADMLIVSWFSGPAAVSGVSNGGQVTMLVMSFAIGLSVGGTVLVGQYFGAGRRDDMKNTIGTIFTVLAVLSVLFTVVMILLSEPILRLLQVPDEAMASALDYLNICMTGTLFIFGYNAVSAVLRGMGDSKRPLMFVVIACIANVGLDFLLVGAFGMGAAGAAIATVAAQGISLVLSVIYLARNKFVFDFKLRSFRVYRDKLSLLLKVGLPTSLQQVMVGLSFLVMMALVNGYGVNASAAVGIVGKFNSFAILPVIAMSASVSSMAAQNLGAGLPDRAMKTMTTGIKVVLPLSAAFFLIGFFAPQAVLGLFTNEPEVIALGSEYLRTFSFDYIIVPFSLCFNGLLTGAGHTTFTMFNAMLSSVGLRVPVALLFGQVVGLGLMGIGLGAPVGSLGGALVSLIYIRTGRWKRSKIGARIEASDNAANSELAALADTLPVAGPDAPAIHDIKQEAE